MTIITPNEIIILKALANSLANSSMYLGIYTFVIIGLFALTILTLPITLLEKKLHIVIPMNMNIGKYCSDALNTAPNINIYISIEHTGSISHHSQLRYEFATSERRSAFAERTA
jgi:hypothetical protein